MRYKVRERSEVEPHMMGLITMRNDALNTGISRGPYATEQVWEENMKANVLAGKADSHKLYKRLEGRGLIRIANIYLIFLSIPDFRCCCILIAHF